MWQVISKYVYLQSSVSSIMILIDHNADQSP